MHNPTNVSLPVAALDRIAIERWEGEGGRVFSANDAARAMPSNDARPGRAGGREPRALHEDRRGQTPHEPG